MLAFAEDVRNGVIKGATGAGDHRRRQYRHRRLGPRAGDGRQGAGAVRLDPFPRPFRLQRRWRRHRRHGRHARPGAHPVHHFLQDVHHPGDDDQRAFRARLDRGRARPRRDRASFRGGLDATRQGRRVRHRQRSRVRLLGLGRRPLFDLVEHRPAARASPSAPSITWSSCTAASTSTSISSRAPDRGEHSDADGPAVGVEPQHSRPRLAGGDPLRSAAVALPGLSPAVADGEQRQGRRPRRQGR